MSENNRVIWSEGMFLRPQHFQQHDRYLENWVHGRCAGLRAFDWGFRSLKLDQGQLAIGRLALLDCRGAFADGTPFDLPDDDELPLALELPEELKNGIVYLALSQRRPDACEIDSEAFPDSLARFRLREREVRDHNSGADGRYVVQIGGLRPRLMLAGQERAGYVCLGVAKVVEVRSDKTVVLDEQFIPPVLYCSSAGVLSGFLRELHGLLHTRGEALAGRVVEAARGGASEIADFLLLQAINRYQPVLEHLGATASLHPEEFYRLGLQLAGELATFYKSGKRPISFPPYNHDDLQATFTPLMDELRQLLGMVLEQNAIQIPLSKPKFGVYAAKRPDLNLLDKAIFVLAVNAKLAPESLRTHFPPQVKIGPVEDIQQLVRSALPGISIHPLPVAPRQLPYHAGFSYFELNKQSDLWKKMSVSGGFAIHIGGNFPDLELEFWAIKKG
ncbi:MAG: type VI secretion system baseplate subunit TssK [Methylococcaceae bacterium]|nr:type VI secretion system baseplate subunit TssK [Methylococcaceae bacterium]